MKEDLFLNAEKALRLKRILDRLENILFHESDSRASLFVVRKRLRELVDPLSLGSKTRECAEEILRLSEEQPFSAKSGGRCAELATQLREIYQLDTLRWHIR